MIFNVYSVTSAFLAGVGLLLALVVGAIAVRGVLASRRVPHPSGLEAIEDSGHLLGVLVAVLAGLRLLAWGHFYFLLESYVADLAPFGVMCVYGVTKIQPTLILMLQFAKPLLLLVVSLWWLLGVANQRSKTNVFLLNRFTLALPISALAGFECIAEAVYLVREKIGQPVTCCTQFLSTQVAGVTESVWPLASMGVDSPTLALVASLVLNAVTIAGAYYLSRRGLGWFKSRRGWVFPVLALVPLINLLVTRVAWLDTIAPRVLQLPYHHCIYELITDTPLLGLAAVMAIAGNACLLLPLALQVWYKRAPETIGGLQRTVYGYCAIALATEVLIVGVHAF